MRVDYTYSFQGSTSALIDATVLQVIANEVRMKMKQLEQQTGVNREVIRIFLRKGLIPAPRRPARNVAEYDERHVRAIATVRDLQRSGRLSLDQIGDLIEGRGLEPNASNGAYQHLETLLAMRFGVDESPRVTLAQLTNRLPEAERDARTFTKLGMIDIVTTSDGEMLSLGDARLVEIWSAIREAGFVEERGFPPENIAFYKQAAEMIANEEVRIFLEGSAGRIADDRAAAMLQTALPMMLDFLGLLRLKAFLRAMRHALENQKSKRCT
ncbi:MAG: MerR family transcriptional regulator [Sphingomonadaceae bacterium]